MGLPSRRMPRVMLVPGETSLTATWRALPLTIFSPLSCVMTSPCVRPARLAGESGVTCATMAPEASLQVEEVALSGVTSFMLMPR